MRAVSPTTMASDLIGWKGGHLKLVFLNVVVSPLFDFDGFLFWERIGTNYSMNMDELGRLPSGKLT